ncbi:hypothetical protein QWY31_02290 [Cytophagales bacterium LB-30]|uniref:Uncharacterized protein n=1 Tax=Shiella aurantiaca TaxID=3058365 RepID=A0ABT8F1I6_9BACT|nr:hypothetical protein [Shiella aurantiaca]MDN4164310.1 hypothetical protein [Shiella aurantiaca]
MNRLLLSVLGLLLLLSLSAQAQKIKYKDLFPLLNSKSYEPGEKLLKQFIAKEPDHANAHLQMGIMYETFTDKLDVVKEKDQFMIWADSSIMMYKKAATLIDEKELKRNDDLYQAYNRRDLRTGKFEIKLSDVQLDIEKAVAALETRKKNVEGINLYFEQLKFHYNEADQVYSFLFDAFRKDMNLMLLMADAPILEKLNKMVLHFDSVLFYQKKYSEASKAVRANFNQGFVYEEIKGLAPSSLVITNFYSNEIRLNDFGDWASKAIAIIETDIERARRTIVEHDNAIKQAANEGKTRLPDFPEDKLATYKKYDSNPFIVPYFEVKQKELVLNALALDSTFLKGVNRWKDYAKVNEGLSVLTANEALYQQLDAYDNQVICNQYATLITENYGSCPAFLNQLNEGKKASAQKKEEFSQIKAELESALRWGITEEGDSLALFTGSTSKPNAFYTLQVFTDSLSDKRFVLGLKMEPKVKTKVFIAQVTPDLKAPWLTEIPTNGAVELANNPIACWHDGENQTLFVVSIAAVNSEVKSWAIVLDKAGKMALMAENSLGFIPMSAEPSTELPGYKLFAKDGSFILIDPQGKIRK